MVPGLTVGSEDAFAEERGHDLLAVVAEAIGVEVRGQNGFDILGLDGGDYAVYLLTVTILFMILRLLQYLQFDVEGKREYKFRGFFSYYQPFGTSAQDI